MELSADALRAKHQSAGSEEGQPSQPQNTQLNLLTVTFVDRDRLAVPNHRWTCKKAKD